MRTEVVISTKAVEYVIATSVAVELVEELGASGISAAAIEAVLRTIELVVVIGKNLCCCC